MFAIVLAKKPENLQEIVQGVCAFHRATISVDEVIVTRIEPAVVIKTEDKDAALALNKLLGAYRQE